jgi:hypothetical protein
MNEIRKIRQGALANIAGALMMGVGDEQCYNVFRNIVDGYKYDDINLFSTNNSEYFQNVADKLKEILYAEAYILPNSVVDGENALVYVGGKVFSDSIQTSQSLRGGSLSGSILQRIFRKKHVDSAIYLRHTYEVNYFHFLCHILPRLVFADLLSVSKEVPCLVSGTLTGRTDFLEAMRYLAAGREIVVQAPDETVACDRLYALFPERETRKFLDYVQRALPERDSLLGDPLRIALIREKETNSKRVCDNYFQIVEILGQLGYVTVDPASLTVFQQKHLFSRARHIVAEYGAALANIVFCKEGTRVDAIALDSNLTTTFPPLALEFGIRMHVHCIPSQAIEGGFRGTIPQVTMRQIIENAQLMAGDRIWK